MKVWKTINIKTVPRTYTKYQTSQPKTKTPQKKCLFLTKKETIRYHWRLLIKSELFKTMLKLFTEEETIFNDNYSIYEVIWSDSLPTELRNLYRHPQINFQNDFVERRKAQLLPIAWSQQG